MGSCSKGVHSSRHVHEALRWGLAYMTAILRMSWVTHGRACGVGFYQAGAGKVVDLLFGVTSLLICMHFLNMHFVYVHVSVFCGTGN